jgi:hypothetical protein
MVEITIRFISVLLVLALGAVSSACVEEEVAQYEFSPSLFPDRVMLTIPGDPATSRAVTWRTSFDVKDGLAQLAESDADPVHVKTARSFDVQSVPWEEGSDLAMGHRVLFENLASDTMYSYRVGGRVGEEEYWSEWFQFTTSTSQAREFRFLYFGDLQNNIKSLGSRTLRQAYRSSMGAEFMLFAGDLVNRSREDDWGQFFHAGGWIFAETPTLAAPGNHEYDKSEEGNRVFSRHWQQIFTFPENGPAGLHNRAYFLDYQGVRLISLDSYLIVSDESSRQVQTEWLKGILKDNPNKWTIAFMHHPVFSCSYGRDNQQLRVALKPLFEHYGVDLVLQGHDHTYCRGNNVSPESGQGSIPVYVVSVAGPKMYGLNVSDWKDRVASSTQLYQIVHVKETEIKVESFTVSGELYDSFRIVDCDGVRSFIEDPGLSRIPARSKIPKGFLDRYSSEKIRRYRELYRSE